jgi:hypothetical protein
MIIGLDPADRSTDGQAQDAIRRAQVAGIAADSALIRQARSSLAAARLLVVQNGQALLAAREAYVAATMRTAATAGRTVAGPEGSRMQAAIASIPTIEARIGQLRQIASILRIPCYSEASGFAYAIWDSPLAEGMAYHPRDFTVRLSHLLYFAEVFLPAEISTLERRYPPLIGQLAGWLGTDTSQP